MRIGISTPCHRFDIPRRVISLRVALRQSPLPFHPAYLFHHGLYFFVNSELFAL